MRIQPVSMPILIRLPKAVCPLEYKLLDYKPEQWSNLKIGLFLKQMSKDLASYERDLEFTNAKAVMTTNDLNVLYPQLSDSSDSHYTKRHPVCATQYCTGKTG